MLRNIGVGALCSLLCASVVCLGAQLPSFEVASVRLAPVQRVSTRATEARVDLVQPLRSVLLWAFRVGEHQLVAPDWLNGAFVEIHATMPSGARVDQVPDMLRRLLIERFALVVHSEQRSIEGYDLSVGVEGIKMAEVAAIDEFNKEYKPELTSSGKPMPDRVTDTPEGPVRQIAISGGVRRITSRTMYERTMTPSGAVINAIRMSIPELVSLLSINLDAPVVDRTGLTGLYKFKLELPQDGTAARLMRLVGGGVDAPPPSISTSRAVESLGLKLERRHAPVEVIVIDTVKRAPIDN